MDLSYGERYERFRSEVREFLEKYRDQAPPGRLGGLAVRDEHIQAWQRLLIEHGYAARTIPREYGGYGAEPDALETVILDEEFAAARVLRGIGGQGPDMLVPTFLEHASEEQKRRWIRPTLLGEVVWCQGYSEPEAGSDLASVKTTAVLEGDEWVVNGQKIWTTTAQIADMMFALVRTEPDAPRHAGISYLLIPMHQPGIDVRPLRTMTGGAEFNEVFLTNARAPAENLVGVRGEGWKIGNTTLRHERNMLGSASQSYALFQQLLHLMRTEVRDGRPVLAPEGAEGDDEPKKPQPPPVDYRLVFHEVDGMAIMCTAPPRPGLPNQFHILDAQGQTVRHGNFDSLVEFLERRHGGPLPKPDLRSERSYREGEPSRPDKRELPPPAPGVVRSYERCLAGRL